MYIYIYIYVYIYNIYISYQYHVILGRHTANGGHLADSRVQNMRWFGWILPESRWSVQSLPAGADPDTKTLSFLCHPVLVFGGRMWKDKFISLSGWWFLVSTPLKNIWLRQLGQLGLLFPINMESHSKFHGSSHHQAVIVRGVSLEVGGASGASLSWPTNRVQPITAALFLKAQQKSTFTQFTQFISVYLSLSQFTQFGLSFFWTWWTNN